MMNNELLDEELADESTRQSRLKNDLQFIKKYMLISCLGAVFFSFVVDILFGKKIYCFSNDYTGLEMDVIIFNQTAYLLGSLFLIYLGSCILNQTQKDILYRYYTAENSKQAKGGNLLKGMFITGFGTLLIVAFFAVFLFFAVMLFSFLLVLILAALSVGLSMFLGDIDISNWGMNIAFWALMLMIFWVFNRKTIHSIEHYYYPNKSPALFRKDD